MHKRRHKQFMRNLRPTSTYDAFHKDADVRTLKSLLDKVGKKYSMGNVAVLDYLQDIEVPISIFRTELSPLETIVKYLKENRNIPLPRIADLLGRSRKTVWQAYNNACGKKRSLMRNIDPTYSVPVSTLRGKLSILEATAMHIKEKYGFAYREMGDLLQRNERTIWTVCHRARKKLGYTNERK